jgi:uncharacterized protein (DUF1778 family)
VIKKRLAADGGYLRSPNGPEKLTALVTIRMTPDERRLLEVASRAAGENPASFTRRILKALLTGSK